MGREKEWMGTWLGSLPKLAGKKLMTAHRTVISGGTNSERSRRDVGAASPRLAHHETLHRSFAIVCTVVAFHLGSTRYVPGAVTQAHRPGFVRHLGHPREDLRRDLAPPLWNASTVDLRSNPKERWQSPQIECTLHSTMPPAPNSARERRPP